MTAIEVAGPVPARSLDGMDWRLRIILWYALFLAVGFWVVWWARGAPFSIGDWALNLALSAGLALLVNRGLRRSPSVLLARLRRLYFASAAPDLSDVAAILQDAGDSEMFVEHRRLVDYAVRGLVAEDVFHLQMRQLVAEESWRSG